MSRRFLLSICLFLHATITHADDAKAPLIVSFMGSQEHGLAIVLQAPSGGTFLIDSGHASKDYDAGRDTLLPFLQKHGITEIAAIALSHAHSDHYGGTPWVLDHFPVKQLVDSGYDGRGTTDAYRAIRKQVVERGGEYRTAHAGDKLAWDPALDVEVLSPPPEYLGTEMPESLITEHGMLNGNSLVLRIQHGKNVFLFPGDAYGVGQRFMMKAVKPERLRATVLCAPHHGFNCSPEFAAMVKPEIVVASCLPYYKDSEILSPAHKITEQFAGTSTKVFTTAWHGTVTVVSDGEKCAVTTSKTLDRIPPNPDREKAASAPVSNKRAP
jgi:competence protein ComEC